MFHKLWGIS